MQMKTAQTEHELIQNYQDAVDWVNRRTGLGIRPGLERMQWLMEQLEHPERRLKCIHVAGTNGKGSTCAIISRILQQNGYDVGMFTSPYLYQFNDRIQYNGTPIPEAEVVRIVRILAPLAEQLAHTEWGPPTSFEVCTAMALLYFAQVSYPDYVVIETGLGGRLDSTNIIWPVLTVITNVGYDHMEILGNSLESICREKAGIVKAGIPVVSGVEQPEAIEVLDQVCFDKRSSLYLLNRQFRYETHDVVLQYQRFDFHGLFRDLTDMEISMNGPHQLKNAAVALMALEVLRQYDALVLDDTAVRAGLQAVSWPGRMEVISYNPIVLLDGAHNPEGARSLAEAVRQLFATKQVHLLIGMLKTKDHRAVLQHLLPLASSVIVTQPDFLNPLPAEQLAEKVHEVLHDIDWADKTDGIAPRQRPQPDVIIQPDWREALTELLSKTPADALALVTGTLYMVSDVRSRLLRQELAQKGW